MKQHQMQKPLVQSALVILGVILLIGFVAGSEAEGFFGGITSIFKGVFFSILFAIALALALVFSVLFLFGIFLGAVALYSPDSAKNIYHNLKTSLFALYSSYVPAKTKTPPEDAAEISTLTKTEPTPVEEVAPAVVDTEIAKPVEESVTVVQPELTQEMDELKKSVASLSEQNTSLNTAISEIKASIEALPGADLLEKIETLESQYTNHAQALTECTTKLEQVSTTADEGIKLAKQYSSELKKTDAQLSSCTAAIDELRQKLESEKTQPASYGNHRIFNYLEKDEDKKKFADLIAEAIESEMTYAEIDNFLSKSLSKSVDTKIKEHPSLTKQYIRDCKNK